MKIGTIDYKKVSVIDGIVIFADSDGYFIFEHYSAENSWYSLPVRIGKTSIEVEKSLTDYYDWNYRLWHGEMTAMLKAQDEVRKLPDIQ